MSKKKPLPYAARWAVEQAIAANSEAIHALEPLIEGRLVTPEESMRRLAKAVHNIHSSTGNLKEAMNVQGE